MTPIFPSLLHPGAIQRAALCCASLLFATCLAGIALAEDLPEIIARVDSQIVTTADVESYSRLLTPEPGETKEALQRRAHDLLLANLVAQAQLMRGPERPADDLLLKLQEAQRRVVLDYYVTTHTSPYEPTAVEIAEFVRRNPQMFSGRAIYRYVEIILQDLSPEQNRALQDELAAMPHAPLATGQVTELMGRMRNARIPFQALSVVRNSEQLPMAFAALLDQLWAGTTRITTTHTATDQRLVFLLDRVPDPVNAADIQDQIVQGLIRQNATEQRSKIIRTLAQTALDSSAVARPVNDAPLLASEKPLRSEPPRRLLALTMLMSALTVAAIGLAFGWRHRGRVEVMDDEFYEVLIQSPGIRLVLSFSMIVLPSLCLVVFATSVAHVLGWHGIAILSIPGALAGAVIPPLVRRIVRGTFVLMAPFLVALVLAGQIVITATSL